MYKEIGKPYPFASAAEIPMGLDLDANSLSGFIGYQSVEGVTDSARINAIDLNVCKNAIEQQGKVKVLYMVLSWNGMGFTDKDHQYITDCRLGAVWVTKTTVNAQTVFNSLPSNLLQTLNDLQMISRKDFKAYVDGTVSTEHVWEWTGETQQHTETVRAIDPSLLKDPMPYDTVKQACKTTILSEAKTQIEQKLADYQPTVTLIEPSVDIVTTFSDKQYANYTIRTYKYTLKMSAKIHFTTVKPLADSPIAPAIIAALAVIIKYLIVAIVIGLVVYFAWATFVSSFFVKTSTLTSKTTVTTKTPIFDANNNIIGYEETTTTKETMESVTEPAASVYLYIIVAAIVIVLIVFMFYTMGRKRK